MAEGGSPIPAVWLRNVHKSYGHRRNKVNVLKGIDMTVPHGAIYGLLGPSGCGKTTLLRSILGRLAVDSGQLIVLGDRPGASGHGVPGTMVGYMPQETALYEMFTIGETLTYFGRIHGMSQSAIIGRTTFLLDFLTLSSKDHLVGQLSGGQMRRVSFAVALLQEPELLILDEPTVGVDPVLRERIWEHLLEIAQSSLKTTIIITTHYIEEARQADKVGLMRNGRLLDEETPSTLMHRYSLNSLEDVFLHLCHADGSSHDAGETASLSSITKGSTNSISKKPAYTGGKIADEETPLLANSNGGHVDKQLPGNSLETSPGVKFEEPVHHLIFTGCHCLTLPGLRNSGALIVKNLTVMKRNVGFMLFEFILPSIQIVLFCLCIGKDPFDLPVAVVNSDTGSLGNMFVRFLDNNTIDKSYYTNISDAVHSVRAGDSWGVIAIGQNFSTDIFLRFEKGMKVKNSTLQGSTISLFLDMTNQQIAVILEEKVTQSFQIFAETMLSRAHVNPDIANIPIKVEDPIYGEKDPSFTNFMAPGIILSITFFMATGLTTLMFVLEKKEGLLDRSFVAGVVPIEVMMSHIFTQLLVLIVQVALLLVFALFVFNVPYKGPLIWVVILVLLQGFCGMTLGMIFSVVCDKESSAIQLALGSVYPMLLLSGIIWPIEAVPTAVRYVSICLPMTYASEAMRSVLSRGWDITYLLVWRGYLVTIGWSAGLLLIAAIILRIKQ